jgi:hypothetical protein
MIPSENEEEYFARLEYEKQQKIERENTKSSKPKNAGN